MPTHYCSLCSGIDLAELGHNITVLERTRELSGAGAGIHVPPNATLLLQRWGILDRFRHKAVEPAGFNFRRYDHGSILASSGSKKAPKRTGQTPYWSMRRADYQHILYEAAVEVGCDFRFGEQVVSIDGNAPSVTVKGGEVVQADIIIAADGIKSQMRRLIIPEDDVAPILQPLSTYRAWAREKLF
ncbi:FAD/NAD(P)-binding domain-containing protein, protein [Acrodontium crateriforme]|uniref:FAD/NAD(P)-binding domain-containing protein, protein n=1 Tax=Acrodontium crateriforme TaxID=150365 RepID=A0AAQ3M5E6_9PEZI|nr:FAD/NAD(P)-binding domain-containing protein, protein [Acrodontium crateriforme]